MRIEGEFDVRSAGVLDRDPSSTLFDDARCFCHLAK